MKQRWAMPVWVAGLFGCAFAMADVDLSGLDDTMPGTRAQVLVLGSVHLSGMPDEFKPESLEPLLERLAAFKPDIITIEAIAGEGCDLMARHPSVYGADAMAYCRNTDEAKAATGLDVPAAIAEVKKTLAEWPSKPEPAQRRKLAALFLAANEAASALTQWLQLESTERRTGDGLDAALVAALEQLVTRRNENTLIAAQLAARLGLQRVIAIDDHTGDNISVDDEKAYGEAIMGAWASARPAARAMRAREDELKKSGDMLALYRYINEPANQRIAIASDFGAALRQGARHGQLYVAGWETRNLRMVANVRAAFRDEPGARVLSIVGSSHKPWFDNLLGTMLGVDLVDVAGVLQARPATEP